MKFKEVELGDKFKAKDYTDTETTYQKIIPFGHNGVSGYTMINSERLDKKGYRQFDNDEEIEPI